MILDYELLGCAMLVILVDRGAIRTRGGERILCDAGLSMMIERWESFKKKN
jgi:hypothetical protein